MNLRKILANREEGTKLVELSIYDQELRRPVKIRLVATATEQAQIQKALGELKQKPNKSDMSLEYKKFMSLIKDIQRGSELKDLQRKNNKENEEPYFSINSFKERLSTLFTPSVFHEKTMEISQPTNLEQETVVYSPASFKENLILILKDPVKKMEILDAHNSLLESTIEIARIIVETNSVNPPRLSSVKDSCLNTLTDLFMKYPLLANTPCRREDFEKVLNEIASECEECDPLTIKKMLGLCCIHEHIPIAYGSREIKALTDFLPNYNRSDFKMRRKTLTRFLNYVENAFKPSKGYVDLSRLTLESNDVVFDGSTILRHSYEKSSTLAVERISITVVDLLLMTAKQNAIRNYLNKNFYTNTSLKAELSKASKNENLKPFSIVYEKLCHFNNNFENQDYTISFMSRGTEQLFEDLFDCFKVAYNSTSEQLECSERLRRSILAVFSTEHTNLFCAFEKWSTTRNVMDSYIRSDEVDLEEDTLTYLNTLFSYTESIGPSKSENDAAKLRLQATRKKQISDLVSQKKRLDQIEESLKSDGVPSLENTQSLSLHTILSSLQDIENELNTLSQKSGKKKQHGTRDLDEARVELKTRVNAIKEKSPVSDFFEIKENIKRGVPMYPVYFKMISNPELKKLICGEIYRESALDSPIGDGGTAAILRFETDRNESYKCRISHYHKAKFCTVKLFLLKQEKPLSLLDQAIVTLITKELREAVKYADKKGFKR